MRKKISFIIVTIVVALTIPLINIEAKTLRDYITEVEEMIKELENYDEERAEAQARAKEKEQEIAEKYANIEKYSLRIQKRTTIIFTNYKWRKRIFRIRIWCDRLHRFHI